MVITSECVITDVITVLSQCHHSVTTVCSQCYHGAITALSRSVAFRALILFGVHAAFRSLSLSLSHSLDEKRFLTVGRSRCTLCACGIPLSPSVSCGCRRFPITIIPVCVSRSPCWLNPCVCVCVCVAATGRGHIHDGRLAHGAVGGSQPETPDASRVSSVCGRKWFRQKS